jgi:DNA adenine methylase
MDLNCPVVIPYYGGKFTMSRQLVGMLPPHRRYFEPFFGGGSMFFRKKRAEWNILNDIDNDLVNLYMCVISRFSELCEYIRWFPRSRQIFEEAQLLIKTPVTDNPNPKRAAMYFFAVRNGFNNIPNGSFSKDTKWDVNIIEELKLSKKKLDNCTIENMHFGDLVKRYEPRQGDFFYFDPPYVVTDKKTKKNYYRNVFDDKLHDELKQICDFIDENDAEFMVSYDNKEEISELYKNYNLNHIKTKYVGTKPEDRGKVRVELLITNFQIKEQGELF